MWLSFTINIPVWYVDFMYDSEPSYLYPHILRTDGMIQSLFDHEIYSYKRGFVAGMFGSQTVKTGSGKSVAAMCICKEYDDDFSPDNIVFTPAGVLQQLAKNRPRGSMFMCEETQNYASNRTWFKLSNKTIMHTVATMRSKRQGTIFITPMARMIDGDVQKMMRFAISSWLGRGSGGYGMDGWVRIREIATYNNDKDIARREIKFYNPETKQVVEVDKCRVYLPDRTFLKECEQKIEDYKATYHEDLQAEAEQYEEAEKALYRKAGVFKPKDMADKMLSDNSIINELTQKGKIGSGTVSAFYPGLKNSTDIGAVKWWVESNWQQLKLVKK